VEPKGGIIMRLAVASTYALPIALLVMVPLLGRSRSLGVGIGAAVYVVIVGAVAHRSMRAPGKVEHSVDG
jgi:hypothetical protein